MAHGAFPAVEPRSFDEFLAQFGRRPPSTSTEEAFRRQTFAANLDRIRAHNSRPQKTWLMGINQFADMTDEEFERTTLMEPQKCSATNGVSTQNAGSFTLPDS